LEHQYSADDNDVERKKLCAREAVQDVKARIKEAEKHNIRGWAALPEVIWPSM